MYRLWSVFFIFTILIQLTPNSYAIKAERIASGFSSPLFLTSPPGDFDRLFIVEQNSALIKIIKNGAVLPTAFIDLNSKAGSGGEGGLLGLAFHPDYSSNGFFFVNYTDTAGDTVVARYAVSANPDIADPSTEFIITEIDQPFGNHNGGMLAFSPIDGLLYIFMGDGGSANDPGNRAQTLSNEHGKIHRVNVDTGVTIPPGNPFTDDPSALDSIWSYGLRNPWRASFDRLNGDLYIGDVGQGSREEISWQPGGSLGGENYGWRCMEGTSCTGLSGCTCNAPSLTIPIHDYSHSGGNCSVTGGYVYRGSVIPSLNGTYFLADFCTGRIWSFKWNGSVLTDFQERTSELVPNVGSINNVSSFGEDAAGELYIIDLDGEVFKILPNTPQPSLSLLPLNPNIANTTNSIEARGATPNSPVRIIWGFEQGTTDADNICPGLDVGIEDRRNLTTINSDGSGIAVFNVFVPQGFSGLSVFLQAVDIVSCTPSNVTSQTIDSEPPLQFELEPLDPGQAGIQNTLSTIGGTSNGDVRFIWGFSEGIENADSICSGLEVGISEFNNLITVTADENGLATFIVFVPQSFAGLSVVIQAADISSCSPSNVISVTF